MCPVVNWVISEGAGAEQEMEGTCQEKKQDVKIVFPSVCSWLGGE